MDAVSFLVSRGHKSAGRLSLYSLLSLLALWLYYLGGSTVVALDSEFFNCHWLGSLIVGLGGIIFGTLVCAVLTGATLGVPAYQWSQLNGTLRSWSENRILDEMTSTGLTERRLVNALLRYHLGRWLAISMPTVVALTLYSTSGSIQDTLLVSLAYVGSCAVLFSAGFFASCWTVAAGPRGQLFSVLALVPQVILGAAFVWSSSIDAAVALFVVPTLSIVYSYFSGLWALNNRANLSDQLYKLRNLISLKLGRRAATSENPIVAREQMRGQGLGNILASLRTLALLGFGLVFLFTDRNSTPLILLVLVNGFIYAYRAADRLAQSLTAELESSTLETLRTTPMGSQRFLEGWLQTAVRPLVVEYLVLSMAAAPFITLYATEHLAGPSFLFCLSLGAASIYLGGLFGASIAGQLKPRQEVAGQISTILAVGAVTTFIEVSVFFNSSRGALLAQAVGTALVFVFFGWVLKAGAHRSLNRVFLPQK